MLKKGISFILAVSFLLGSFVKAQQVTEKKPRIALFAPFYLDTLFNAAGTYKQEKNVPAYARPAIDFYQGMLLALDSLDELGIGMDVQVFDTRNKAISIYKTADSGMLDGVDLIIGAVSGSEYLDLATVAREKKIPFVSATYPNDGGISGNPFVVIANPKLNTHLQALYNYVLKTHGTDKLLMLRRKNGADDRVSEVFKSLNSSGSGSVLNIQTVTLSTPPTIKEVTDALDENRQNVIICGSLDDNFGKTVLSYVASLASKYKITLVGMPTWEGFGEITKPELRNAPVIYSTSLFSSGAADSLFVAGFKRNFGMKTYTLPNETAYRGYELTFYFGNMLAAYGADFIEHMGEEKYRVLTDFNFKPIHWSKTNSSIDYYENKRVYILRQYNGMLEKLN